MNIKELEQFLQERWAGFQIIQHATPILTLADRGKYFDARQAVPTLILQSDIGLLACMVSAAHGRIDLAALKSCLNLSKLKLANREMIRKKIGYETGAIPLVGHNLPCIIDRKILKFESIDGGSGHPLFTLKISPRYLVTLNHVIHYFE